MKCKICGQESEEDLCNNCNYYNADKHTHKIKFRGKSKLDGSWKYGDLIRVKNEEFTTHYIVENGIYYDIFPVSVDQFTSLKDIEDNEIYKFDVVKRNGIIGVIIIINGSFEIKWKDCENSFPIVYERLQDSEIIGNVHENRELFVECWN